MKYIITSCLVIISVAGDKLENIKPPPSYAALSGGHNALLSVPYQTSYKGSGAVPSALYKPAHSAPLFNQDRSYSSSGHNAAAQHTNFIPIVKHSSEPHFGDGSYAYSYEGGNGISASEYGVYKPGPTPDEGVQSAVGSFSYTGPDNVVYSVTYTAGSEGFVPVGAHLPTPPPIPDAIQRGLQYNPGDANKLYSHPSPSTYGDYQSQAPQRYTAAYSKSYPTYTPQPILSKLVSPPNLDYKVSEEDNYTR